MRYLLRVLLIAMAVLKCAALVWGQPTAGQNTSPFGSNAYRVPAYTVHDGDTLTAATVELDFGAALIGQSIRFFDFDAWEISSQRQTVKVTAEEKLKGKAARDDLAELLKTGEVWIRPTGDGKSVYGRLEAEVWLVPREGPGARGEGSGVRSQGSAKPIDVGKWMRARDHERK